MKKITPFLWFDTEAEEAMNLYVSIFKNSKVLGVTPGPNGTAMSVNFELEGQEFIGLNAGPQFKFNEAISFLVSCNSQAEVDELWEKLTADGGEEGNPNPGFCDGAEFLRCLPERTAAGEFAAGATGLLRRAYV